MLGNQDSYLEGKLDSADDVDCYAFSYIQRALYDRMGISSKITISLEILTEGCDYDLVVYDEDGNQIGIAEKNSDGSRELTLPEWDHNRDYVIRVENRNGETADMDSEKYRQISAYREVSSFLQKATGRQYKWEDISKETDKISFCSGLPRAGRKGTTRPQRAGRISG